MACSVLFVKSLAMGVRGGTEETVAWVNKANAGDVRLGGVLGDSSVLCMP